MKALTVWQPWASLIVAGAKRYEFRRWSFAQRPALRPLVGQRIVVHAGARMPKAAEVADILERIADGVSALDADIARPALTRLLGRLREYEELRRTRRPPRRLFGQRTIYDAEVLRLTREILLGCGLGTAILGEPKRAAELFDAPANDSYRADHSIWAWPLIDVEPFEAPIPATGAQGFWEWKHEREAA